MIHEIKLKYYNSTMKIGFNDLKKEVYDCNSKSWLKANYHLGRLVYGSQRIPYKRISSGIDKKDFIVQIFIPF